MRSGIEGLSVCRPLQALSSIMARWLWRNLLCISHQTRLIQTHALFLTQNREKLVHGKTFELERNEYSSSNAVRTLHKSRPLFLRKFWSSKSIIFSSIKSWGETLRPPCNLQNNYRKVRNLPQGISLLWLGCRFIWLPP